MGGKQLFSFVLLSFFITITASISLCHSDDAVARDPCCPACNFQSSCVAIDTVEVFLLPEYSLSEVMRSETSLQYSALVIIGFPARPPPHD